MYQVQKYVIVTLKKLWKVGTKEFFFSWKKMSQKVSNHPNNRPIYLPSLG
jgi:hypothetical protein